MNESMSSKKNGIENNIVESASRCLAKMLRHNPEEFDISLNDRGWASVKSVRVALNREFDERAYKLIQKVLEEDDSNRFQITGGSLVDDYAFIRATRKHTCEDVSLPELYPDEDDLSWYLVEYENKQPEYVEATSVSNVKKVAERRSNLGVDWSTVDITELDDEIYIGRGSQTSDSLSGNEAPHAALHQSADKPLQVEKRVNQMGRDKGRYRKAQTSRVRDRKK